MPRIKHVFGRSNEVCHVFANQRQVPETDNDGIDHARNGSDNCSFDGNRLKSYRTVIATRHGVKLNKRDFRIVLLSDHKYSNTTSGHQSEVRHAFRGHSMCRVVEVLHCDPSGQNEHLANMSQLRWRFVEAISNNVDFRNSLTDYAVYVLGFNLSKFLSKHERELLRYIDNFVDKNWELKQAELPTVPQSTLPVENEILKRIADASKQGVQQAIRYLMGFQESEAKPPTELEQHKQFQAALVELCDPDALYVEQCISEKHAAENAAYRRKNKELADWVSRMNARTGKQRLHIWRIADGADSTAWVHEYFGLRHSYNEPMRRIDNMSGSDRMRESIIDAFGLPAIQYTRKAYYGSDQTILDNADPWQLALCRLNNSGDVETSKGVTIPQREFIRWWTQWGTLFSRSVGNSTAWAYAVEQLEAFQETRSVNRAYKIDWIDRQSGLVKAGCHMFPWEELNAVAQLLGLPSIRFGQLLLTHSPEACEVA